MLQFLKKLLQKFKPTPTPEFIAQQLRKPHGAFAKIIGERMNESNRSLYKLVLQHLQLSTGDQVLEIGFGNGHFFKEVSQKAEELKLYGIDYSAAMVKTARKNNIDLIRQGLLEVQMGNSDQLPYAASLFDAVFCINVIYFWDKPFAHLQEIGRVMKPGARFYVGIRPKEIMEKLPFTTPLFKLRGKEEIQRIFAECGFELIQTHQETEPPVIMYGATYDMAGMCMIFEKKV
ncbi:class I SAM-dependent methyltransferase [Haliscomenobacter sp.]|uniref:class I SAM-dependent methyltransferase n=1 Tax=Haliscomenobacter sp. TaxID=2717303 RepID=UPI003593164F